MRLTIIEGKKISSNLAILYFDANDIYFWYRHIAQFAFRERIFCLISFQIITTMFAFL